MENPIVDGIPAKEITIREMLGEPVTNEELVKSVRRAYQCVVSLKWLGLLWDVGCALGALGVPNQEILPKLERGTQELLEDFQQEKDQGYQIVNRFLGEFGLKHFRKGEK